MLHLFSLYLLLLIPLSVLLLLTFAIVFFLFLLPFLRPFPPSLLVPSHTISPIPLLSHILATSVRQQLSSFSSLHLSFLVPSKVHISCSVILSSYQYWLAPWVIVFLYVFCKQNPAELAWELPSDLNTDEVIGYELSIFPRPGGYWLGSSLSQKRSFESSNRAEFLDYCKRVEPNVKNNCAIECSVVWDKF